MHTYILDKLIDVSMDVCLCWFLRLYLLDACMYGVCIGVLQGGGVPLHGQRREQTGRLGQVAMGMYVYVCV